MRRTALLERAIWTVSSQRSVMGECTQENAINSHCCGQGARGEVRGDDDVAVCRVVSIVDATCWTSLFLTSSYSSRASPAPSLTTPWSLHGAQAASPHFICSECLHRLAVEHQADPQLRETISHPGRPFPLSAGASHVEVPHRRTDHAQRRCQDTHDCRLRLRWTHGHRMDHRLHHILSQALEAQDTQPQAARRPRGAAQPPRGPRSTSGEGRYTSRSRGSCWSRETRFGRLRGDGGLAKAANNEGAEQGEG